MFTELMPLLRKRRLLLTLSLVDGDTITASTKPQKLRCWTISNASQTFR